MPNPSPRSPIFRLLRLNVSGQPRRAASMLAMSILAHFHGLTGRPLGPFEPITTPSESLGQVTRSADGTRFSYASTVNSDGSGLRELVRPAGGRSVFWPVITGRHAQRRIGPDPVPQLHLFSPADGGDRTSRHLAAAPDSHTAIFRLVVVPRRNQDCRKARGRCLGVFAREPDLSTSR
jgi:hypothetical protein